jgi:predicted nucleic acid-binding protein
MRRISVSETLLVDTSAWIALFDPTEEHHRAISGVADLIDSAHLVMPWPVVYETLRTRFVRRSSWVAAFDQCLRKASVTFVDDADYCREAYELSLQGSRQRRRDLSMVDILCRMLIDDPNIDIKYLLTCNKKDFYDVCLKNGVEVWP